MHERHEGRDRKLTPEMSSNIGECHRKLAVLICCGEWREIRHNDQFWSFLRAEGGIAHGVDVSDV